MGMDVCWVSYPKVPREEKAFLFAEDLHDLYKDLWGPKVGGFNLGNGWFPSNSFTSKIVSSQKLVNASSFPLSPSSLTTSWRKARFDSYMCVSRREKNIYGLVTYSSLKEWCHVWYQQIVSHFCLTADCLLKRGQLLHHLWIYLIGQGKGQNGVR